MKDAPNYTLETLRREITDPRFVSHCATSLRHTHEEVIARIHTVLSETELALQLLRTYPQTDKRVLEVGCGMGLTSLLLHKQGAAVVPIEPEADAFDLDPQIGECFRRWSGVTDFNVIKGTAEDLREEKYGTFDLIYSINVLEHISDLEAACAAMSRVLKQGGDMLHTCPNYTVPYEPHFGIVLIPIFPKYTGYLLPKVRRTALWKSLNFITLSRVRRIFLKNNMICHFQRGVMYNAFERIGTDEDFRTRQGNSVVTIIHTFLKHSRLLKLIAHIPPVLATPMIFEVIHKKDTRDHR